MRQCHVQLVSDLSEVQNLRITTGVANFVTNTTAAALIDLDDSTQEERWALVGLTRAAIAVQAHGSGKYASNYQARFQECLAQALEVLSK